MSLRNFLFIAAVLCALTLAHQADADESSTNTVDTPTNSAAAPASSPTFSVSLRPGETIGDYQVMRAFLTAGTNEIAFTIPNGFRMDASNPDRIVLTDGSSAIFITIRLSGPPYPDAASQVDFFRGRALSRFPGAKIASQSSEIAANHSGPAFDLEWLSSSGSPQAARIAFIPCAAGVLEFSVLTQKANFKDADTYLSSLMVSVRTNEAGKIVIRPEPGYS